MPTEDIKEDCFNLRMEIEVLKAKVKAIKSYGEVSPGSQLDPEKIGEIKANVTLAYRHLEDARMRLGKAVQAWDGGKSVYPR